VSRIVIVFFSFLLLIPQGLLATGTLTTVVMTKQAPDPNSCTQPPATTSFSTTDQGAWLWFLVSNVTAGDDYSVAFYTPAGTSYGAPSDFGPETTPTPVTYCYSVGISIAGYTPATMPGAWNAYIYNKGSQIYRQPFTIAGSTPTCSYSLSATSANVLAAGGSGSFTVTVSAGCTASVSSDAPTWITLSVSGNTVNYTVQANTSTSSRIGHITVGTQTFTITQAGTSGGGGTGTVTITEYPVPTAGSEPWGIAVGSDGNLWFTEDGKIGKITTAGAITEYPLPNNKSYANAIVAGPDGAMWFVEGGTQKIGRITTSGTLTEYPIAYAPASGRLTGIAVGPDGALWYTDTDANSVGRITTSGNINEYPVPTLNETPWLITAGPDGAMWFAEDSKIGRVTTAGVVTEYNIPSPGGIPWGIVAGPDGALWFTEEKGSKIGRITTAGVVTEYPVTTTGGDLSGIAVGPASDGALWFSDNGANKIARITTTGAITEYPVPTSGAGLRLMVAGPDGAIWFTEQVRNQIGRVVLPGGAATCTYVLSSSSASVAAAAGSGSFTVTTGSGCALTATADVTWITPTVSGSTVNYTVQANTTTSSRTGHITVGTQTFTITQAGTSGGGGTTTGNLILNGDAESGPGGTDAAQPTIPFWTTDGQIAVTTYAGGAGDLSPTTPGPANRGNNYFAGGPNNASSRMTQTVDLSSYASAIDAGTQPYTLDGWLGGYGGQDDNAVVTVTFQSASGGALGTASIGPVLDADRGGVSALVERSTSGNIPTGTRKMLVTVTFTRVSGSYNDGALDNLSFVLGGGGGGTTGTSVYYRFENGTAGATATGSGSIVDSTGNQNGTPSGTVTYSSDVPLSTLGGVANTLSANFAANGAVQFPGAFPLNSLTNATLEFYVKPTGTISEMDILWTRTDSSADANRFNMGVYTSGNSRTVFMDYRDTSGNWQVIFPGGGPMQIPYTGWSHVAVVKSGNVWTGYINGIQMGQPVTGTLSLPNNTGWTMNGNPRGSGYAYTGLLDEFRISNSALTPSQFLAPPASTPSTAYTVTLTPATASSATGTQYTVTAKVTDANSVAQANVSVTFTILSGPNAGATGVCSPSTCKTDSSGQVSFTYTGSGGAGQDSIKACVSTTATGQACCSTPLNAMATVQPEAAKSGKVVIIGAATVDPNCSSGANVVYNGGCLPVTGPAGELGDFTFAGMAPTSVTAANLAQYDTALLNVSSSGMICDTSKLSTQAKTDLVAFVAGGKKLLIHDSECQASGSTGMDYSWLPYPFTTNNPGATGTNGGTLYVVENSSLASAVTGSASFIDATDLAKNTDAVGDMNVMTTKDAHWCLAMSGTNANQVSGPVLAYAKYPAGTDSGLFIYNGFDHDDLYSGGNANLRKVWVLELQQPFNPSNLPCGVAVVGITASPATATNQVGTTHTVTAKVVDQTGKAQANITVAFTVTGTNAGATGTCNPSGCKTDSTGQAAFTYSGSKGVGQDTITACFTPAGGTTPVCAAPVTKTWVTQSTGSQTCSPVVTKTWTSGGTTTGPGMWTLVTNSGDCSGSDVSSSSGSSAPDPAKCTSAFNGDTAVCWSSSSSYSPNTCTYKNIAAASCAGGSHPGSLYRCDANGTTPGCNYYVSPLSQSQPAAPSTSGGNITGLIMITTGAGCKWNSVSNTSWITIVSGATGTGPQGAVSYKVDPNTSTTSRQGTMTIAGQTVTVSQAAGVACSYSITPTSNNMQALGGSSGITVTVSGGTSCSWTASVSSSASSWLHLGSTTSGTTSGSVSYTADANTTTASRTGTIAINNLTFTVTQPGGASATGPTIAQGGIVNAASNRGGGIAQGSFFTIYGSNLGPPTPQQVYQFPIPDNLGGVTVTITQGSTVKRAYMFYVSATQVNGIMPSDAPLGNVQIAVNYNNVPSSAMAATIVKTAYGIFSTAGGPGPGIVLNYNSVSDQPLNMASIPAKPGQVEVMWGTGLGPISTPDNQAPPGGNLPVAVQVMVGGLQASVAYSGRAPGNAAIDQINFTVPAGVPTGCSIPVQVNAGGTWSNTVRMAISADGQHCKDSFNPLSGLSATGGNSATIGLMRVNFNGQVSASSGPTNATLDLGFGAFVKTNAGGDLAYSPFANLPAPGTCSSTNKMMDLGTMMGGGLSGLDPTVSATLDAGAQLTVTGGAGGASGTLTQTSPNPYMGLLGGILNVQGATLPPPFLDGGPFTVSGPGGADVGPFSTTVPLAPAITWTNPPSTINRASPLTLTWTGGDSTQSVVVIGSSTDQTSKAYGGFTCVAPAGAHSFTVPVNSLSDMVSTAATAGSSSSPVGMLGLMPLETSSMQFTSLPTGLNVGVVFNTTMTLETVQIQ
jgi:virginiamycin B lyase